MVRRRLSGKARSLAIVGAAAFVVASGAAFAMAQADRFLDSAGR